MPIEGKGWIHGVLSNDGVFKGRRSAEASDKKGAPTSSAGARLWGGRRGQAEWRWQADSTAYRDNCAAYSLDSVFFFFCRLMRLPFSPPPPLPSQPPPSQRTTDVCLSFSPLIPLVTPSLSPDRSLGLGPRLCLHHQMLIGYRGWVWELENELLTDNSPRCTLHQKKEIEGEGEAKWDTGRMPCSHPRSGVLH